jgi:hypothetical protein
MLACLPMTKPNRWMPYDWGDYWRDTAHLTAAEHGRVDREIARATEIHAGRVDRMTRLNAKRRLSTTSSPMSCATSSMPSSPQPQPQSLGPTEPAATAAPDDGDDAPTSNPPTALKARILGQRLAALAAQSHINEHRARTLTARWCPKFRDGAVLDAFTVAARHSPQMQSRTNSQHHHHP